MVDRLEIPTPFGVGSVNAYLVGRTLVDPGPDSDATWEALRAELERRGLVPGDVDRVLLTHPHPDHVGLAGRLYENGAPIVAGPLTASILEDFSSRLEYEQSYVRSLLPKYGMPPAVAGTIADLMDWFRPFVTDCPVDHRLEPGDRIRTESVDLTASFVRGHAPEEVLYSYEVDGTRRAIVGDHVLESITPNPLLEPPRSPGESRPRVLPMYNESLSTLRTRAYDRFYPGHGDPIDDPYGRIGRILDAHERRTDRVLQRVDGPTSAYEVMQHLFDDLPVTEQFGGMCEAVGHFDVLEERGLVTRVESDGTILYERAG